MPEGMCIFCEGMHAFRQVLWAPCMCRCRCVHYTGVVNISVYICVHACYRVCICAHVCAVCSFSVREQGWRGPTSLWGHLLLGEGGYFWQKERWGYCLCLLFFNAGGSLRGRRCVHTHTHAHCTYWVLGCEPKGRDETPRGPEESRCTKSRHMCFCKCVQTGITHLCVYACWRDEILD